MTTLVTGPEVALQAFAAPVKVHVGEPEGGYEPGVPTTVAV